ncbi:unnamed protein product [Paramecium primaurelia]|uniref:Uncharacterized protein n=1 Tax=Paramecium primaurelia TaxID=5886 RepID=A0A8S1LC31_PARPR|nr:unnamed protein product [Paramecium primaurelia]
MQYQIKQLQTQSESSAFIMEEGVGEFMFDMISNYMIKIKSKKINNQEKKLE